MLLKLTLQLKACVSDCRLTATAQNETGLKKLMLTFPFLIHFLSPSVNDTKSGGKKEKDVEVASSHIIMVFSRRL